MQSCPDTHGYKTRKINYVQNEWCGSLSGGIWMLLHEAAFPENPAAIGQTKTRHPVEVGVRR